jgi:hypothetical protein
LVRRFLKKLKIELPYDSTNPFLGIYPQKSKSAYTQVYDCTIHKSHVLESLSMPTKRYMYKEIIYTHYILSFAGKWVEQEIIMLN